MKIKKSLVIAAAIAIPLQAAAEHEELPTIVVEGSGERPGTFGAAPDSSGLVDTASLLKRVPGANVNRNGPLTGIAAYRGMFGNRVNVMVDNSNMKEVGSNSMDPPLSHIPAPLTGSLKVTRGIAPVSSGIESMGGSMHAESKKGRFADGDGIETSGTASIGYGSVNDGHYGALLGAVANKNHKVYLSGSKEKARDFRRKNNSKVSPTQYDREAFTTGYGYQREGHEFGINYSNNNTGHSGTPALPMDIMYVRGGLYNTNYKWDMGDGFELTTNLTYQKMRHLMDNNTLRTAPTMMGSPMLMQNNTKVEAGGIDLALTMPLFDGALTVGVNGDQSNHDGTITGSMAMMMGGMPMAFTSEFFNRVERDRYSVFTEWTGDIAENLNLELGARFNHTWTDSGKVSDTRMAKMADVNAFNNADRSQSFADVDLVSVLRYAYSSELDIEVGLARKNRMPTYQELYLWTNSAAVGGLADGNTYIGDLGLNHETAYQFELGFDWHTENFYAAPRAFYHYVDDYIQGLRTANAIARGNNILQFSNISAQFYGIDFETGYTITDNWRVDAGLNYVRAQRVNANGADDDLYRIAPLNGRAQVTFEQSEWMGAVEGIFVADQGDVAAYNNEQKTTGYMLLNLRGQYEPYHGLVIGTGIENVLDTHHQDHLGGYNQHNRANGRVAMPGRNIYATLSYSW